MKRIVLGLCFVSLVAGTLVQFGPRARAEDSAQPEYWYSSDPRAELLTARFTGGLRAGLHSNTVFGDGRYEYKLTDHSGAEVWGEKLVLQLSQKEVTALLDRAVNAGLMEYDKDAIEQRMSARASPFYVHDAVTMFLDIHLERYRGPGQKEAVSASRSMSIRAVGTQAKAFPKIEEIQALNDIAEELNIFKRRAEEQNEN